MMIETANGIQIKPELLRNYFDSLIDSFFKILPMKESGEGTLCAYIKSLQRELLGGENFVPALQENPSYLKLLCILQYFIDNPDCDVAKVKSDVFKAIRLCNKLKSSFEKEAVK